MQYNQFCPIAKATEILGERWTMLILRELLMGGRRFSTLQRGLGDISPALLTKRLRTLEEQGMVIRRRIPGQRGYEYFPTEACEALLPVLVSLGEWSLVWARYTVLDTDLNVELLMLYPERSVDPAKLKGSSTVIKFRFPRSEGTGGLVVDRGERQRRGLHQRPGQGRRRVFQLLGPRAFRGVDGGAYLP
ncbi:MAG: helix-turn-helix transcriptional regulator [Gammaproteobacteria bacterium]|nr:helix-turn-helix transcriptional regulator [Gammaproteobacteria bacterium]